MLLTLLVGLVLSVSALDFGVGPNGFQL